MKHASYRNGIDWIAFNDEPECDDPNEIAGFISSILLAELFGVTNERVAADVIRLRKKLRKEGQL